LREIVFGLSHEQYPPVGLVPTNALVLIEQINSRMVNSEAP